APATNSPADNSIMNCHLLLPCLMMPFQLAWTRAANKTAKNTVKVIDGIQSYPFDKTEFLDYLQGVI
ncbi:MAG: hypothetical protein K8953_13575, partial [Proteobacteria bacterium]|nr:hypothetical protein [Pseudomonadota bacterium]